MEVIANFKLGLLLPLQKMVMLLMWMRRSSCKVPFTRVPWNPRSVSAACYSEAYMSVFRNFIVVFFAESYLANLALYPGRTELPFLPTNTQVLIHFIFDKLFYVSMHSDDFKLLYLTVSFEKKNLHVMFTND